MKKHNVELDRKIAEIYELNLLINNTQLLIDELNKLEDEDYIEPNPFALSSDKVYSESKYIYADEELNIEDLLNEEPEEEVIRAEGLDDLAQEIKSNMNKSDSEKYDRYIAVANLIQDKLPHRDIFIEVIQSQVNNELNHDMSLMVSNDNGHEVILSPFEKEAVDSGELTLEKLIAIINSFK